MPITYIHDYPSSSVRHEIKPDAWPITREGKTVFFADTCEMYKCVDNQWILDAKYIKSYDEEPGEDGEYHCHYVEEEA